MKTNKNLNLSTNKTSIIINRLLSAITNGYETIKKDILFKFNFITVFMKTFLFILLISTDKASTLFTRFVFLSVPPILVYISFICIFLSFSFLFKNKGKLICFIVLNIFLTFVYISDILYYRANSSFLDYHMMSAVNNLNNLSDSILAMFRPIDIFFILDILVLIVVLFKPSTKLKNASRNICSFLILIILSLAYLGYAHYKIDVLNKGYANEMLFRRSWAKNQTIFSLTPIGYHLFDIYNFYVDSKPYELNKKETSELNSWLNKNAEVLPDNEYKGMFKGKNLIILQVESLENFVIGKKINGQEITPNLNKLIKNSLYFNKFHEETHNGTTSDAELMTNTSVYPVRSGSTFFRYPANKYKNSLPNIMERQGYSTLAAHPDKGTYWNWLPSLSSIGFSKCYESSDFNLDEIIGLGLSDRSFLNQLPDLLSQQKQPFFSFSITLTSHTPFNLPNKFRELKLNNDLKSTCIGKYFQSIRYTDTEIGHFIDKLDKQGILDNSVVVLYGDHEGVHKFQKDEVASIKNNQDWWVNNHLEIPLIIYSKDFKGKVISVNGGQVDILPTISYLMGIDPKEYSKTCMGRNLLNTNRDFFITSTGKYIGKEIAKEEKSFFIKGIELSDKIIRSNYFKD